MSRLFFLCAGWISLVFSAVLGCGSSSPVRPGSISIISANDAASGQLTSIAVTQAAVLSMSPAGDKTQAGVDWTVSCGGSPLNGSTGAGACGMLTPAHTSDTGSTVYTAPSLVPYLTTVTITAAVTSDPAARSSVTLPIVPLPIAVTITASLPSVGAGQTLGVQAATLNDASGAGVALTIKCGSSACGSLDKSTLVNNSAATFTAPASVPPGGTVTITGTSVADSTKSASVTVAITAQAISVSVTPAMLYAGISGASRTMHLTATVLNDLASGGVNWTLACGSASCGAITGQTASGVAATFLGPTSVPTGNTVTITATSVSDPTKLSTALATITAAAPITVMIAPSPAAALAEGTQETLTATVGNDPSNAGVDWTVSCASAGACGTFNLSPAHTLSGGSILYTAPASIPTGGTVTITASPSAAGPSDPASFTTTITLPTPVVAFLKQPPSVVTATTRVIVSASVTNDTPPGGITWSVQCSATAAGACGYVAPYQTADGAPASYVAPPVPPAGTVTVIATSIASPAVTVTSGPITIVPSTAISIGFVPFLPSQLGTANTVTLTAAVQNDSTNAGVDWQVCASGCGFFTTQAAIPEIAATPTTPLIPAVPAVTATTVQDWSNGLAIPYTAPSSVPEGGYVAVSATAHHGSGVAAASNIAITGEMTGPSLIGAVQAGTTPVAGAAVSLYAAGQSGYGSPATLLSAPGGASSATTDSHGAFTLGAGYTCPANAQVYLVAVGGKTGSGTANPNLSMMTALGPCSNLSSTSVVVNEVTTVASVWALAPFSTNQPLTGLTGYLNIGASSTNSSGLGHAFATVNNLVEVTTGEPRYNVPVGNAAVPYVEINTLANMLNSCTASAGGQYGDGSPCGNLFTATAPLYLQPQFGSTPPTDTIQAAFNVAQNPSSGTFQYSIDKPGLFNLITANSPFQPTLAAAPQDFSISLHFTGGGGLTATSGAGFFAIDASNNLWVTSTSSNSVAEWNSVGAAVSPPTGFTAGGLNAPGPISIDFIGNVWIANANSLTELSSNGLATQGTPFYGVGPGLNMAIDGLDNIWITNSAGVNKFNDLGTELSPVSGYQNDAVTGVSGITIDPSNNIWIGSLPSDIFNLAELGDANGQLVVDAPVLGETAQGPIVADGAGNIWSTPSSEVCKLPPFAGIGTELIATCYTGGVGGQSGGSGAALATIDNPNGIALDGSGNLWIANAGGDGVPANLTKIIPSQVGNGSYGGYASSTLAVGPLQAAVDGSGDVWVLLSDNTITEFIGAAVPAVTPTAAAIKNKKLGKTP